MSFCHAGLPAAASNPEEERQMIDIQKASVSKRLYAFLLDMIIASILTSGLYLGLSAALRVESHSQKYKDIIAVYEQQYGVQFGKNEEEYAAMSEAEQNNYKAAVDAANSDEEANKEIKTFYVMTFTVFASGIILSMLILEFIVPMITRDGRTLGKLLFGLGVMRKSCLRIGKPVLFIRGVIGKGVFELILPVMILYSVLNGFTGVFGIILLCVFVIFELVVFIKSGGSELLHDMLSDTVVVDWGSQMIFDSAGERDEYAEKLKKQQAESDPYNDQNER